MSERKSQENPAGLHPILAFSLLIGLLVSSIGDEIYMAVMILQLKELSASGTVIAAFLASQLLPSIFLTPVSGQIVDRFETSRVLVTTQILQTFVLIAMANTQNISLLLLGAFGLGCLFSISQPALYALIPKIAEQSKVATKRVNAMVEFFNRSALLVGPALGGLLLGTLGAPMALLIDAATFTFAALVVVLVGIRRPPAKVSKAKKLFEGAFAGFRILRQDPVLRIAFPLLMLGVVPVALIGVTFVFMVTDVLGQGPVVYGLLFAMWGVGMLIGSVFAGRNTREEKLERPSLLSMAFMGSSLLITGLFPRFIVMLVSEIYGGIANGIMNVSLTSLLHSRTPPELHGRVFAAYSACVRIGIILGYALAGPFSASYPQQIYIISGVLTTLVGFLGYLVVLRRG